MDKQKKIILQLIAFFIVLLSNSQVFAANMADYVIYTEFSEDYEEYLELSDKEQQEVIVPRMYEIPTTQTLISNPFKLTRLLRSTSLTRYSLADKGVIPENMVIKSQKGTNSCWAFAMMSALESNLALKNKINQRATVIYDFSETHMDYSTSKTFADGVNESGFNRELVMGGNADVAIAYLTNGTGAIDETEMEFVDEMQKIKLEEIQGKTVTTKVNDTVNFPSYKVTDNLDDLIPIKQQMKKHISNYGGISASIYGAGLFDDTCYNNETGALYCNDRTTYKVNHSITIIGWDDEYKVENFSAKSRPTNPGAWIIKNSWGEYLAKYTLTEMKQIVFDSYPDECAENGWNDATEIDDDYAKNIFIKWGYTIENDEALLKVGKNGFMYVSYEDVNIYRYLTGIIDAQNDVTYENIYQYDQYGGYKSCDFKSSKIYMATVFEKKTDGDEYITQVSVNASETYTCKVYINPNGTDKDIIDEDFQVQLKTGDSETFDAGYHTIEFLNPVKITGDNFVIVLEIEGTQENLASVIMEFNYGEFYTDEKYANAANHIFDCVTVENEKCFVTLEAWEYEWIDTSTFNTFTSGMYPDFDTTIKAFTVSKLLESIEVEANTAEATYIEGQNFDTTGMNVIAKYSDGSTKTIKDYAVSNGTYLQLGQTSVTIAYEDKTVEYPIKVIEDTVEKISIINEPTITEYLAGEQFDKTGMIIEATYKSGNTQLTTEYTILDGQILKNGQTVVTIEYEGNTTTQKITVNANPVVKLEIIADEVKLNYIVGQNFNSEGMVVKATYESGLEIEVTDYIIVKNGSNLQENQTAVEIEYEGQTVTQGITVELKSAASISVKSMPIKTKYIQNKEELDLTGGVINILYNDGTSEEMTMTSDEIIVNGFDNEKLGIQTIILTYQNKTTQFDIKIKEEAKPKNSDFDNIQGKVTRIRSYYFTDITTEEYTIINIELSGIEKATENDNMEYYYYLSSNPNETVIANWVKIDSIEDADGKMAFEINTLDVPNYEDVVDADNLYLYVKEVATRNDMIAETVTSSVLLEVKNINIEEYVDGEKSADINSGTITGSTAGQNPDNTLASGTIPNAGKSILIIALALVILVIGRIAYLRYKDIEV